MALIATPGAANANSFKTLAEFNEYLSNRLFVTTAVSGASDATKESALIMATRLIGRWFIWNGQATYATQALPFPRIGLLSLTGYPIPENVIPQELKDATSELAYVLLTAGTTDPTAVSQIAAQGITKIKASSVEITFKDTIEGRFMPDAVAILIPPSWYSTVYGAEPVDYASIEVL